MEIIFLVGLVITVVSALVINKPGYYLFSGGIILILLGFLYAANIVP